MLRDAMALLSGREPGTRDAAALRALLAREVAIAGSEDQARARLEVALARYDERRISTIHAFAAWVLAEFPLETGVVPGPVRLVDGTSRWREAADDLWRERSTGADGAAFAAQYGKPDELVKLAKPFRQFPVARIVPSATDAELVDAQARLGAAYAAAARAWHDGAAVAANLLLKVRNVLTQKKGAYDIPGVNEATEAWRGYFEAGEAEGPLAERAELYTRDAMMRNRTPGAIKNAVPLPRHPVFDALSELWRAHRLVRGIRTARGTTALVAELERRARALMTAAGERSFDDLIGVLHGALTGAQGAQLARALRTRLPLGLIDEFQDTDVRQYEIFRRVYVANEDEHESDIAAPSLILVGDPKQSIYRFRGGDVYAYRIAGADVRGEPARLERNYRSEPIAVDAVNALFRDVSFRLDFVRYHPVEPVRPSPQVLRDPALDAGLVLWDAGTGSGRGHKQDALIEWSLAACADEIVRLLSGEVRVEREGRAEPLTPDDIAVLLPWNRDVARMARCSRRVASARASRRASRCTRARARAISTPSSAPARGLTTPVSCGPRLRHAVSTGRPDACSTRMKARTPRRARRSAAGTRPGWRTATTPSWRRWSRASRRRSRSARTARAASPTCATWPSASAPRRSRPTRPPRCSRGSPSAWARARSPRRRTRSAPRQARNACA
jgi:exodeoxyribonuclease V beta subunit